MPTPLVNDALVNSMPNALLLLFMIFNCLNTINRRNYKDVKFKVLLAALSSDNYGKLLVHDHVILLLYIFFQICDKFEILIFQR